MPTRRCDPTKGIPKDQPVPAITFTPRSVNFDHRTYSLKGEAFTLFTPPGRAKVGFACGPRQKALLATGLPKDSVANVSLILTVDRSDLDEKAAGRLSKPYIEDLDDGLRLVLALEER